MPGSPEGGSFSNPETTGEITDGASSVIRVDQEWCVGHGVCEKVAPDVFTLDEGTNIAFVTINGIPSDEAVLPDTLSAQARAAERQCPQVAIEIIE